MGDGEENVVVAAVTAVVEVAAAAVVVEGVFFLFISLFYFNITITTCDSALSFWSYGSLLFTKVETFDHCTAILVLVIVR